MQVFLSVGRVGTPEQERFLERLETKVRKLGLEPRTIGRNTFTSGQPLDQVKSVMRESKGVLALAFERTRVSEGREYRGLIDAPVNFGTRRYATPWHHIELAMASVLNLPTLVVAEEAIHVEGMLEDKYGWYVYRAPLLVERLDCDEFNGILADWAKRCAVAKADEIDPGHLSVGQLVKALKPAQLWGVLAALGVAVSGAFAAGGKLPALLERRGALSPNPAATPAAPADGASASMNGSYCIRHKPDGVIRFCSFESLDACMTHLMRDPASPYARNHECVPRP